MVAQGYCIIAHIVQQVHLDPAPEHCEIGRALVEIAGIQQQHVASPVGSAYAVDEGRPLYDAQLSVVATPSLRVYMAVGVVGMQYCKSLGIKALRRKETERRHNGKNSFHIYLMIKCYSKTTRPSSAASRVLPAAVRALILSIITSNTSTWVRRMSLAPSARRMLSPEPSRKSMVTRR